VATAFTASAPPGFWPTIKTCIMPVWLFFSDDRDAACHVASVIFISLIAVTNLMVMRIFMQSKRQVSRSVKQQNIKYNIFFY
jgi:hypothetical protein